MKYMMKLAMGLDTTSAAHSLARQPELWGASDEITLRADPAGGAAFVNWFTFDMLPLLHQFIFGIMSKVNGEMLGEVKLHNVSAGKELKVPPVAGFEFYHMPVMCAPGVLVQIESEGIMLLPGDAWWASGAHELKFINNSADDLIVLLVQARPNSPATYVPGVA